MPTSNSPATIRVAAAQFHIGTDLEENLATCLRMIRKAAECKPDLIVLPEFCNHLSWYEDQDHCDRVSIKIDGPWLQAIAAQAKAVSAYVVVNVTLLREDGSCTGTSLLYSPEGKLLADNDKQIYIGHENDFLVAAKTPGPIIDTPLGKLGMYACMDGVINETPRCLSLNGAQLILNSVNSFAPDEGSLHMPVRAAENRVFMIAANKCGPLIPEFLMGPVSEATGIPQEFLCGAGDSQIVAPDGTVLALAGKDEEVIWADIDPSQALNKINSSGTDIFTSRRPELYQAISEDPVGQAIPEYRGVESMAAAMIQLSATGPGSIDEAVQQVATSVAQGASLVVLPELFFLQDSSHIETDEALALSGRLLESLAAVCSDSYVVASAVIEETGKAYHAVVCVGSEGVIACQPQLHRSARLAWSSLGDDFITVDLPFGRLGLVAGTDSIYPEVFRMLAIAGAEVVAVPFAAQEVWELKTGLVERAAENRLNLVVATQPSALGCSFANKLHRDFTVMTPWQERAFDGNLTYPLITRAGTGAGITLAELTPFNARDKIVSLGTDVVRGRPWRVAGAITRQ